MLVERARMLLNDTADDGRAIAFLSFTNSAVSELEHRLRQCGLFQARVFPHFIGTFDRFLWQFLIAPFGVPGCDQPPRLIPDKNDRTVRPGQRGRELPLSCFAHDTGAIVVDVAKMQGFQPDQDPQLTAAYVRAASQARQRFLRRGELDFADVRAVASERLNDHDFSSRLASALAGRFCEIIVDEAQDCNPSDLQIIQWLREAGITVKVICDPHQSIYEFRGGVTDELITFGDTFDAADRLTMSGNFRSSDVICKAIAALRPPSVRDGPDAALGPYRGVTTPIHILAYKGTGVPSSVGEKFRKIVEAEGISLAQSPVLAATRRSGAKAVGQPGGAPSQNLTMRLAAAVTDFHVASDTDDRLKALDRVHHVILELQDRMGAKTYHQYLASEGLEPGRWRPEVMSLVRELRYDRAIHPTPDAWHARAKALLGRYVPPGGRSIAQRLPRDADLRTALAVAGASSPPVSTIHAVKGMEFPAVCVVMTVRTTAGILDYLDGGASEDFAEEARKIYVAASRAQRLLAIAVPRSQAQRLADRITRSGADTALVHL